MSSTASAPPKPLPIPAITIAYAVVMILLGVATYFMGDPEHRSGTAFIPSAFGVVFLILGLLAGKKHLRMHVMHAAALLALIAIGGALSRAIPAVIHGTYVPLAVGAQFTMAALSALYLALCIKSFIDARILRKWDQRK